MRQRESTSAKEREDEGNEDRLRDVLTSIPVCVYVYSVHVRVRIREGGGREGKRDQSRCRQTQI